MTILGNYSVADVVDFVNAKNYDIGRLQSIWNRMQAPWASVNQGDSDAWAEDWAGLLSRWAPAYSNAENVITAGQASQAPLAIIPAQDTFLALLHAIKQQDGVVTTGDYDDLWQRLNTANKAMGGDADFSNWQTPQPVNPDADLTILQLSDHIIGTPSDQNKLEDEIKHDLKVAGGIALGVLIVYGFSVRELNKIGL